MKKILFSLSFIAVIIACSSNEDSATPPTINDNPSEKQLMLENWADNIIIPSFQNYQLKINSLSTATATFNATPNDANLEALRTSWLEAYKAYQYVSIFEIGPATQNEYSLRMFSNTYPMQIGPNVASGDLNGVNENIISGSYNLTTLSSADEQGFPALDYLLNGLGADNAAILAFYTSNPNATNYKGYLTAVTARLKSIVDVILNNWTTSYRNIYVASTDNSPGSATNLTVNSFVKNYEKEVRAGKVGIPAGKYSNGITFPDKVEAYYKNDASKILLDEAVKASRDFFNGKHFNSATEGKSLKTYLDLINAIRDGQKLSLIIDNQFAAINTVNSQLSSSLSQQVQTDNTKMLNSFDALQQNVLYFKLDMMQAMEITVDYADNDGD